MHNTLNVELELSIFATVVFHISTILNLRKAGIVNLGMLAPSLGRNVLVRSNRPSFAFRGYLEKKSGNRKDTNTRHASVALPLCGIHPPSSIRRPNLTSKKMGRKIGAKLVQVVDWWQNTKVTSVVPTMAFVGIHNSDTCLHLEACYYAQEDSQHTLGT